MTVRVHRDGWRPKQWRLLMLAWLAVPATTLGMTFSQMQALPGAMLIGKRVDEVFTTYGLPAAILPGGTGWGPPEALEWRGKKLQLERGNWKLVYGTVISKQQSAGWHNPDAVMPRELTSVVGLELTALGQTGVVVIDKAAHKTTYKIPTDLFKAHKVVEAHARFAFPIPIGRLNTLSEDKCQSVASQAGHSTLRCWVLVEKDVMPIALYAVDFQLTKSRAAASGYTISGDGVDYVQLKFAEYYQRWLDMLND